MHQKSKTNLVSGKVLKEIRFRQDKTMSQEEFGKLVGLSKKSIYQKESNPQCASMRELQYSKLLGLGYTRGQLEGEEELPPKEPTSEYKIEMGLNVDLNFRAVMERYGVTKEFIVREAPLLFMAAAEEFLNKEREIVHKKMNELEPGYYNNDYNLDNCDPETKKRWNSLKNRREKLLSNKMNDKGLDDFFGRPLFFDFRESLLQKFSDKNSTAFDSHPPKVEVLRKELFEKLCLGNETAISMVKSGELKISKMKPDNANYHEWLLDEIKAVEASRQKELSEPLSTNENTSGGRVIAKEMPQDAKIIKVSQEEGSQYNMDWEDPMYKVKTDLGTYIAATIKKHQAIKDQEEFVEWDKKEGETLKIWTEEDHEIKGQVRIHLYKEK